MCATPARPEQWTYKDSTFWRELERRGLNDLKAKVSALVEQAAAISELTRARMPLFALHTEVHLKNVLWWMDRLANPQQKTALDDIAALPAIKELGPVGCALCILAAYLHDLGMAPTEELHRQLQDPATDEGRKVFDGARRHLPELAAICERPDATQPQTDAQRRVWEFLVVDHLRRHHAGDGANGYGLEGAIEAWLPAATPQHAEAFVWDEQNVRAHLLAICHSHNLSVEWLRGDLGKRWRKTQAAGTDMAPLKDLCRIAAFGANNNVLLPGLLLRLADIMDLDQTRTPPVLYLHVGLGLESLPALQAGEDISRREWQKHLAVTQVELTPDHSGQLSLVYHAPACPSPAIAKTLRSFVADIRREAQDVRDELQVLTRELELKDGAARLLAVPKIEDAKIAPAKTPDGKKDAWIDIPTDFTLQPDAVFKLLMGTSLYADPRLCIRELLQNALDAVELREARQELRRKLETEHGDAQLPEPVEYWNAKEQAAPKITLTWGGEKDGERFIRITDHGTGMTERQITDYFAKVGRSYYQSPEQREERRLMREQGIVLSPISQFGIGFLSCFMLADRVQVRTRPCGAGGRERRALDFTVTGPGTVFHFTSGTLARPGTEITLWLKRNVVFAPWTPEQAFTVLREHFSYARSEEERKWWDEQKEREQEQRRTIASAEGRSEIRLHPGVEAAKELVWPRFDVEIAAPGAAPWCIDAGLALHFGRLSPWDQPGLEKEAARWECPPKHLGRWQWGAWDWRDEAGPEATGSRIRLVAPVPAEEGASLHQVLAGRAERMAEVTGLAERLALGRERTRYLVQAMHVPKMGACVPEQLIGHGVGAHLWVDWRGPAAPRLTAARDTALPPEDLERWRRTVTGLFQRWDAAQQEAARALRWCSMRQTELSWPTAQSAALAEWDYLVTFRPSWVAANWRPPWGWRQLAAESRALDVDRALARDHDHDRALALALARDRALAFARDLDLDLARAHDLARALDRARDRARDLARARAHAHARARALDFALALAHALDFDLARARAHDRFRVRDLLGQIWGLAMLHDFANELLALSWERTFPLCGLQNQTSPHQVVRLKAPAVLDFSGATAVQPWIEPYAWCAPFTLFPGAQLADFAWGQPLKKWQQWRSMLLAPLVSLDDESIRKFSKLLVTDLAYTGPRTLLTLLPRFDLWRKPFAEWTEQDQRHAGFSVLWDMDAGTLRWAVGVTTPAEIAQTGLSLDALAQSESYQDFKRAFSEEFVFPEWMVPTKATEKETE